MKATRKTGTWLWALLAAAILTALLTATAFAGGNDFRCWTVDARQWTNQGYRSEKDGVWYLFLPADESLADTVLSFSGSVTAASAGTLDREHGTLTGAFAASDRVTLTLDGGKTVQICAKQSSLPSLRLTLNGTTLEQVHRDKNVKYPGNDLVLTDGDDVLTTYTRPLASMGVPDLHPARGQEALSDQVQQENLRAGHACGQEVDPPGQCF